MLDMQAQLGVLVLSLSLSVGCGAPSPTEPHPPTAPQNPAQPPAPAPPPAVPPPPVQVPSTEPTGSAPTLEVSPLSDPNGHPGMRIHNGGEDTAQFSSWLRIEQEGEGATLPWVITTYHLSLAPGLWFGMPPRGGTEATCIVIAPGSEVVLPGWDRVLLRPRCPGCEPRTLPSGRYRFVALSCDGEHALPSEPWSWTAPPRPAWTR